eukprot:TRINITY_DN83220_c0_g1_i1.p1 TRINITY_DN83220_c0_g1~~TRINITY_DN83220_c0_g1_i1.p1  ORF type:complete len:425 (-),score=60.26 TRINITY_DN83220_c0_g1_i1:26-1300(-)
MARFAVTAGAQRVGALTCGGGPRSATAWATADMLRGSCSAALAARLRHVAGQNFLPQQLGTGFRQFRQLHLRAQPVDSCGGAAGSSQRRLLSSGGSCGSKCGSEPSSGKPSGVSLRIAKSNGWQPEELRYFRRRRLQDIPDEDIAATLTMKMREFMDSLQESRPDPWFHRKSDKLVLSVVCVEVDGALRYFTGMNAEVSLPTGAVCAERSAILHARNVIPGLRRENFKAIAVVEVPLEPEPEEDVSNPLPPCGACMEWLLKLQEANPDFRVLGYMSTDLDEVEERFPDGGRGDQSLESSPAFETLLGGSEGDTGRDDNNVAMTKGGRGWSKRRRKPPRKLEEPAEVNHTKRRQWERLADRLKTQWPEGAFSRHEVVKRMPWFPTWWLSNMAKVGLLEESRPNGKKRVYRVCAAPSADAESKESV